MKHIVPLLVLSCLSSWGQGLPKVVVTQDDVEIRESCEIEIPAATVIADANGNGVLQVVADHVVVRFAAGSVLQGAAPGVPGSERKGIGIRILGRNDVRIEGAVVHGFFNGLVASHADQLEIVGGDFSDNYRQRLRSTPEAEDGGDWLFPHHNDETKWREEYGGALCVESSAGVTIREVRVRRGQNGILLDRVTDSRVYDNDASFLSGWGLALWRSCRNVVTRNAFDFCVRGHVEGVYNRGQDSAGILCFEQSSDNVFVANSVTHGGDGFFGFAGREALGEGWVEAERQRLRAVTGKEDVDGDLRVPPEVALDFSARGCNRNLLIGNDFSYAAAHGIEMTFSEENVFARNRVVENAICGIWGGYSSDSLIVENDFEGNGGMAYGLERGGINLEHASGQLIVGNVFRNNKCAIHLWWDNDAALLKSPGVSGNDRGVRGNVIAENRFEITPEHPFKNLRNDEKLIILQLRDEGRGNVRSNVFVRRVGKLTAPNAVELDVSPGCEAPIVGKVPTYRMPAFSVLGRREPVGARAHLRGRDQIVMDEWGPWDHESPLIRPVRGGSGVAAYEVRGLPTEPQVEVRQGAVRSSVVAAEGGAGGAPVWRLEIQGPEGVMPFSARVKAGDWEQELSGTLIAARWDGVFFSWPTEIDPREKPEAWRRLAEGPSAVKASLPTLDFAYGWGGPKDQKLGDAMRERGPGGDHFGMLARARFLLPKGEWRIKTMSDDGIRVRVDGRVVLENWTWHGPTPDSAVFTQSADGDVAMEVEHFEIDGFSVLRLDLEKVEPR